MIALALIVPLIVLAVLVAGGVAVYKRIDAHRVDGGGVRRMVVLVLAYGLLVTGAVGLAQIVALLVPGGVVVAERTSGDVAAAVALTIVAVPAFLGLWAYVRRTLAAEPIESESVAWGLFVALTTTTFLIGAMIGVGEAAGWLVGVDEDGRTGLGFGLVWSGVWVWAWRLVVGRYRPRLLVSAAPIVGSSIGLWVAAGALFATVSTLSSMAYDRLFATSLSGTGTGEDLIRSLIWLVVGAVVWWWHWLRHGIDVRRSTLRNVHVLVIGAFLGAVAALGAAGTLLYLVLEWLLGDPSAASAVVHFDDVPGALSAMLVGGVVWTYHRSVVDRAPDMGRGDVGRSYRYLLAGVGLVAAATGIGMVVDSILAGLVPAVSEGGEVTNLLLAGVTAIVVGGPVWWVMWGPLSTQRSPEEVGATPRRVYLTLLAGVAGVVAAVTAIVFVFQLLEAILEGSRFGAIVDETRTPFGLLVATGLVAAYHVGVWRGDRRMLPTEEERAVRSRTITLVASEPDIVQIATRLEQEGHRVGRWPLDRPDDGGYDADEVVAAVEGTGSGRVLVVLDDGEVRVFPLRD